MQVTLKSNYLKQVSLRWSFITSKAPFTKLFLYCLAHIDLVWVSVLMEGRNYNMPFDIFNVMEEG